MSVKDPQGGINLDYSINWSDISFLCTFIYFSVPLLTISITSITISWSRIWILFVDTIVRYPSPKNVPFNDSFIWNIIRDFNMKAANTYNGECINSHFHNNIIIMCHVSGSIIELRLIWYNMGFTIFSIGLMNEPGIHWDVSLVVRFIQVWWSLLEPFIIFFMLSTSPSTLGTFVYSLHQSSGMYSFGTKLSNWYRLKARLWLIFAPSFYGRNNCQQWKLPLLTIIASIKRRLENYS
jgi:hypothetical protein